MAKGKKHTHRQPQRQNTRGRKAAAAEASQSGSLPRAEADTASCQTSSSKYPAPLDAVDFTPGRVLGFQNLGNTCFFNSAVQVWGWHPACIFSEYTSFPLQLTKSLRAGPLCCSSTP